MTIRSEKKLICRNDILTYACTESVLKRLTIVDRYIYRPIAHLFLPFINNRLSISPNQLSIISLFTAILSSTFFLRSNAYLGTIFFIAWAIFDCADGSLSRTLMNK